MIFEIASTTLMGGLALKAHFSKSGMGIDSNKLNKIFTLSGLNVKDGSQTLTTQLIKNVIMNGEVSIFIVFLWDDALKITWVNKRQLNLD